MNKIDEFITFLFRHREDHRINITKKMKYGYEHFHISFSIDEEPDSSKKFHRYSDYVEIILDNRNKCIEVLFNHGNSNLIIHDDAILKKWTDELNSYLSSNIEEELNSIFVSALSSCYNKNLYREYQMKKIFPLEDESL
jgi:hypothetical protein